MNTNYLVVLCATALVTLSTACPGDAESLDVGRRVDSALPSDLDAFSSVEDAFAMPDFCSSAAASDGDFCTIEGSANLRVCSGSICVRSQCGDGLVDDRTTGGTTEGREACDDGNDIANDGCELDCTVTCRAATGAADCDDMNPCTDDACTMSACRNNPNTSACTVGGVASVCSAGVCPMASCGNGAIDMGETCDDGNAVSGDGCEAGCTPSCTGNEMCEDGVACNGVRICTVAVAGARRCMEMTAPMACADDGNLCTAEMCVDGVGCVSDGSANDVDRDGYFATSCGGDDCDDTNAMRNPGLAEVCGNGIDDDCSRATPDDLRTTYFVDCDRDTYAASTSGSMLVCVAPTVPPLCRGPGAGAWTTRAPMNATSTDCNASNVDVSPGQASYFATAIPGADAAADFDYNCDGLESPQYPSGGRYLCFDSRGTCLGTTHYTTAPTCGAPAAANRCTRSRLTGMCSFTASLIAAVACR